jgi:hypothetical protein
MKIARIAAFGLVLVSVVMLGRLAWAGSPASVAIDWQVIGSGGAPASAGNVSLNGTIVQTAIGPSSGPGDLSLGAGFWVTALRGKVLYLPVIFKAFVDLPDLVVDSLAASSSEVRVVIRNAGTSAAADDFWVDVSFDPTSSPPQINQPWPLIASQGVVWGVTKDLAAGESLELVTGGMYYWGPPTSSPAPWPAGATAWAYVDSVDWATTWGAVREIDEGNNTRSAVSTAAENVPAGGQTLAAPAAGNLPQR